MGRPALSGSRRSARPGYGRCRSRCGRTGRRSGPRVLKLTLCAPPARTTASSITPGASRSAVALVSPRRGRIRSAPVPSSRASKTRAPFGTSDGVEVGAGDGVAVGVDDGSARGDGGCTGANVVAAAKEVIAGVDGAVAPGGAPPGPHARAASTATMVAACRARPSHRPVASMSRGSRHYVPYSET